MTPAELLQWFETGVVELSAKDRLLWMRFTSTAVVRRSANPFQCKIRWMWGDPPLEVMTLQWLNARDFFEPNAGLGTIRLVTWEKTGEVVSGPSAAASVAVGKVRRDWPPAVRAET